MISGPPYGEKGAWRAKGLDCPATVRSTYHCSYSTRGRYQHVQHSPWALKNSQILHLSSSNRKFFRVFSPISLNSGVSCLFPGRKGWCGRWSWSQPPLLKEDQGSYTEASSKCRLAHWPQPEEPQGCKVTLNSHRSKGKCMKLLWCLHASHGQVLRTLDKWDSHAQDSAWTYWGLIHI